MLTKKAFLHQASAALESWFNGLSDDEQKKFVGVVYLAPDFVEIISTYRHYDDFPLERILRLLHGGS